MAVSTYASGSQTASISTEHFLSSPNVAGKFVGYVDLVNMAAGDVVELRVYVMTVAGGTARVAYVTQYAGVQPADGLIAVSPDVTNALTDANAVRFSLKQTFGTGRVYPWRVDRFDTEDWAGMLATTLTEAYAADTVAPTVQQAVWMLMARLGLFKRAVSGTTMTHYKLDKTTAAMTHTLDDATTPTSESRST